MYRIVGGGGGHGAGNRSTSTRIVVIAGTHGNEPAGSLLLADWLARIGTPLLEAWTRPHVEIILVPALNPCGLNQDTRTHPVTGADLNRHYRDVRRKKTNQNKKIPVATRAVYDLLREQPDPGRTTWVVDLHEGWGWAEEGKGSLGSALYYAGDVGDKMAALEQLLEEVNSEHQSANGKGRWAFLLRPDPPGTPGTLGGLVAEMDRSKEYGRMGYFLLETSGQHNILPVEQRMAQVHSFLRGLMVGVLGAVDDVCRTCHQKTLSGPLC